MSEPNEDPRLDQAIRDALDRRDPGTVPFGLRQWILDLPERPHAGSIARWRGAIVPALGLAAAVLVAVIGIGTFGNLAPSGIAGASPTLPSPSAPPAFDPMLVGPGVSPTEDFNPAWLVVLAIALLAVLVISIEDRRKRLVPLAVAVGLGGWGAVGWLAPVELGNSGWGQGLSVVQAPTVPGSGESLLYELARPDQPFSVGVFLYDQAGPVPVRIEGIVSPAYDRQATGSVLLTAVWVDQEPIGGMSGPARPFTPFELSGTGRSIWLVGRAGFCAVGPAFDPAGQQAAGGFTIIESIDVRVSVLGWPRTVHLPLGFRLVEPDTGCGGLPSAAPSPSGTR